jgi:hypothetical protein
MGSQMPYNVPKEETKQENQKLLTNKNIEKTTTKNYKF